MTVEKDWIVIPDVHGRTFWRDAIEQYPDLDVVFLGDYLDPYPWEHISSVDAISNFNDILQFKEKNKDRVTLLLGNHDFSYIYPGICNCRKLYDDAEMISAMFEDGFSDGMFEMCKMLPGDRVLLSHAGIQLGWLNKWLNMIVDDLSFDNLLEGGIDTKVLREFADVINEKCKSKSDDFFRSLRDVSFWRGGEEIAGSMVWADMREFFNYNKEIYQIFGHTQLEADEPVVTEHWANLDCRHAFIVTESGEVKHLDKTLCDITTINKEYKQ